MIERNAMRRTKRCSIPGVVALGLAAAFLGGCSGDPDADPVDERAAVEVIEVELPTGEVVEVITGEPFAEYVYDEDGERVEISHYIPVGYFDE
jgi:hypothetical protein